MPIATKPEEPTAGVAGEPAPRPHLSSEQVWREIARASFAVISYVTPAGEPRSSGVVYRAVGRRLYTTVSPVGWKAKHIAAGGHVSMTVPVRRGGILSLLFPIPPATVSFHGTAVVHPPGSVDVASLSKELAAMVPPETLGVTSVVEVTPAGEFLTYGLGVSLMSMRNPAVAGARVPVM